NGGPHWRQIELLAAAYSICLKPQCGHSALIFTGDGLATGCYAKILSLCARSKGCFDGLQNSRTSRGGLCGECSGGDLRIANESGPLFDDETRCFQISLQHAFGF